MNPFDPNVWVYEMGLVLSLLVFAVAYRVRPRPKHAPPTSRWMQALGEFPDGR